MLDWFRTQLPYPIDSLPDGPFLVVVLIVLVGLAIALLNFLRAARRHNRPSPSQPPAKRGWRTVLKWAFLGTVFAGFMVWQFSVPGQCVTWDTGATLYAGEIRSYRSRYEETGKQVFLDKLTEAKDSFTGMCDSIREHCADSRAIHSDNPCFDDGAG